MLEEGARNAELCSLRGGSGEGLAGEIKEHLSIRHVSGEAILGPDPPDSGTRARAL